MRIHPLLEDHHKKASCAPEKCRQKQGTCVEFNRCGTWGLCPNPCELCSFWSGCGMPNRKIKECIRNLRQEEPEKTALV